MRPILALAAALALLAASAAAVSAHAVLLRATPSSSQSLLAAPSQVQLLFSEPLDPVFSHVEVQDASGTRVDAGDSHVEPDDDRLLVASLRPSLANGVYTVAWRSLSAVDVHPDEGRFRLFVGVPVQADAALATTALVTSATPGTSLGRWVFYVAASLFGGVLATWKLVLEPLLGSSKPETLATVRRRVYRLVVAGGVLLLIGTLFSAVVQAGAAADVPLQNAFGQPLADLLLRGRYASIWWPRLSLQIACLLLVALGGIDGLASECALATLPGVLLTSALTSHAAALPPGAVFGIAIDWMHILGATAWVGGLIALATFLPSTRGEGLIWLKPLLPRIVGRFARLALLASAVVLMSGVLQSALELGSWAALLATLYGQLVLVKIALLVAMLVLAALNEWRARANRIVGFGFGVRAELTLGVVVFAVAAVLSGTPPARG